MITDGLILVGHVARAHGNKGQVIVNPETDFAEERFAAGTTLLVGDPLVERRVATVRFQQGRPIVGFEGIDTMDAAEALAGAPIKVAEAALAPLPDGTYYRHQLVGCEVQDTDGRIIGVVAAVEGPIEASRLVIDAPHGEVLIPLNADICVEVAPEAKRIRVAAPEGLIDLNAKKS
jgi:16S rRNA processing protein RimM